MPESSPQPTDRADFLLGMLRNLANVRDPIEVVNIFVKAVRTAYEPNAVVYLSTDGLPAGDYRVLRFQSASGAELLPRLNPPFTFKDIRVRSGGILGAISASRRAFLGDPRQFADATDLAPLLAPYKIAAASPIETSKWWMDWVIMLDENPAALNSDELEDLVLQTNLIGVVIENIRKTAQLAAANERIEREVRQIAGIQRALLPAGAPEIAGLRIACSYETAVEAGGDLYDFVPLDETRWAIIIADASGHGPAAAVVAAMVSALFRAFPAGVVLPSDILHHIDCHLNERPVETSFVTAFVAIYEPGTRRFIYSRAGHNPPLLFDGAIDGDEVRQLDGASGLPLGIVSDAAYENCEVRLRAGQTLLLYTDGVTEAGPSAEGQFGVDGLIRALKGSSESPDAIIHRITADLRAIQGDTQRKDDQTLIAIAVI
jgi:sigma-B regulation protein RsbU (phosphoserine phosphatase)